MGAPKAKIGEECIFPFYTRDFRKHSGCTNQHESDPNLFWCATKVDSNDIMVTGQWGYCTDDCPREPSITTDGGNRMKKRQAPNLATVNQPVTFGTKKRGLNHKDNSKGNWFPTKGDCGTRITTRTGRIVGGEDTLPGELPYMALIGYSPKAFKEIEEEKGIDGLSERLSTGYYFTCGGTIINRYYLLSSASCFNNKQLGQAPDVPFWESTLLRKKMRMANGDYRTQIRVTQQKFRGLKLKILLFMKIGIVTLQLDLT